MKIQRKQTIEDELIIEDSKGNEALKLPVKLYVDDILAQYNRVRLILGEAQEEVQKNPTSEKALCAYGIAIVAFFEVIFGKDGAKQVVDYYENRYGEMLNDIAPFIVNEIQPRINDAMRQRAERFNALSQAAKRGQKWKKQSCTKIIQIK